MNEYWQRLELIIKSSGLSSISAFARHIGLNRAENLYQIKRGNNGISVSLAKTINERFPEYDIGWILSGENKRLSDDSGGLHVPYYNYVSSGIFLDDECPHSYIKVPDIYKTDAWIAVQNPDDGLAGRYNKGCILFLKEVSEIIYGRPHLILTESSVLLRIVRKSRNRTRILLVSDNSKRYDEIEMPTSKIKFIAMVCGAFID